jgi:hypothetical protein
MVSVSLDAGVTYTNALAYSYGTMAATVTVATVRLIVLFLV